MFITPKLTTSWRLSYLWNSENNNPNEMFNANNIQPGQAFHVNYALSYEFLNKLRVSLLAIICNSLPLIQLAGML